MVENGLKNALFVPSLYVRVYQFFAPVLSRGFVPSLYVRVYRSGWDMVGTKLGSLTVCEGISAT